MHKNLFEIFLTSDYVKGEEWLRIINKISTINGLFIPWKLIIAIDKNYIRYFIKSKNIIPPIIGEEGNFLFKKLENKKINFKSKIRYAIFIII